jgi:UDP-N-acetylglucosamine--N-acetylmuramyl-(pentapeptide) pyrophosphoryl-undecaprenol N-acetylglucosamine transferase
LTGNPVARGVLESAGRPKQDVGRRAILVAGGSEGSPFLNERVPELLGAIQASGVELRAHHQYGWGDGGAIEAAYRRLGVEARVESFVDDMAAAYAGADFAICSAGAITLSELAIHGVPALLVPLASAAGDHQAPNAAAYSRLTGALYVRQSDWQTDKLAQRLATLLRDEAKLAQLSVRAREAGRPEAARAILNACEDLLASRATGPRGRRS